MKVKGTEGFDSFPKKPDPREERKSYGIIDLKTARRELKALQVKSNGSYSKQGKKK